MRGPSGNGETSLLNSIANIWFLGEGAIRIHTKHNNEENDKYIKNVTARLLSNKFMHDYLKEESITNSSFLKEVFKHTQLLRPCCDIEPMVVGHYIEYLVGRKIQVENEETFQLNQSPIPQSGHTFVARIYDENVPKIFLPIARSINQYCHSPISTRVRIET